MPLAAWLLGAAGAFAAYPFVEAKWFRIKQLEVPVRAGVPRVTILHVSDSHMTGRDHRLQAFLASLPERITPRPDIVVCTGDLLEDDSGIEPVVDTIGRSFPEAARFYVLGSHDYYQARFQNYLKYWTGRARGPLKAPRADTDRLETRLQELGWVSVTNTSVVRDSAIGPLQVAGVDDPYLNRHDTDHIRREEGVALAIGLAHAPDVISEWLLSGFDLAFAGHTHAGQVRFPGIGSVVTNSSLPNALSGGLHPIGGGWLHVSPGLGTGKFAPIRFNCRPEVTVLHTRPS